LAEPASLSLDPRALFIESVNFTAPNTLSLQGGVTETVSQLLAQKGLGGTVA